MFFTAKAIWYCGVEAQAVPCKYDSFIHCTLYDSLSCIYSPSLCFLCVQLLMSLIYQTYLGLISPQTNPTQTGFCPEMIPQKPRRVALKQYMSWWRKKKNSYMFVLVSVSRVTPFWRQAKLFQISPRAMVTTEVEIFQY